MVVEICATSVQSAQNAQKAGAQRIEICSELAVGGVTPSYGFILQILEEISIPIHVLIRPRSGNFVYSDEEFETMLKDIELCKDLGCEGVVSGVLNPDFSIDLERTEILVKTAYPMSFTFHRGFDLTPDPIESLVQLMHLNVNRILTSGQEESAAKGLDLLVELKELSKNQLTIMPGGGINPSNVHLFYEKGFNELHASASGLYSESELPKISMNSEKFWDESKIYVSDVELIEKMVDNKQYN